MAGYVPTALGINNQAGDIARAVWVALDNAHAFSLWLADSTHTDGILTAAPFSMVQGDLDVIRPAIVDLGSANGLWGVAHSQKTVLANNDFFFNAKKLTGGYFSG